MVKDDINLQIDTDNLYIIEPKFPITNDIDIQYKILKYELNPKAKNILFIIVGLSLDSFTNNLSILNKNIDKIKDKYKYIYFFQFNAKNIVKEYIKYINQHEPNKDESIINNMIQHIMAKHIDKIIRQINKKDKLNIDLLGVSFGGGIASIISKLCKIKKLILVAPGITEGLKNVPKNQDIILSWCIQDNKLPYTTYGIKLINQIIKYPNKTILLTDIQANEELTDDVTHRLQTGLFDIL